MLSVLSGSMSAERRNIKIPADTFEQLNEERTARGLTWDTFFLQLLEDATAEDPIPPGVVSVSDDTAIDPEAIEEVKHEMDKLREEVDRLPDRMVEELRMEFQ